MRDWLSSTIEQELKNALEWQRTGLNATISDNQSTVLSKLDRLKIEQVISSDIQAPESAQQKKFSNDGSNLRITCTGNPGKFVQLLDVSTILIRS